MSFLRNMKMCLKKSEILRRKYMSMPRETKITCPNCDKEGNFTIWYSVNVDSDPETREQVKKGKLFEYVCKECGENFNVEYKFLYHDSRRTGLMQIMELVDMTGFARV